MRKPIAVATVATVALVAPAISAVKAATGHVVQIALRDSSTDPAISGMQMKAEPSTVKAGRITLEAINQSKDLVHEVLVIPAPADENKLPYDPKTNTIVEKRAHYDRYDHIQQLRGGAA